VEPTPQERHETIAALLRDVADDSSITKLLGACRDAPISFFADLRTTILAERAAALIHDLAANLPGLVKDPARQRQALEAEIQSSRLPAQALVDLRQRNGRCANRPTSRTWRTEMTYTYTYTRTSTLVDQVDIFLRSSGIEDAPRKRVVDAITEKWIEAVGVYVMKTASGCSKVRWKSAGSCTQITLTSRSRPICPGGRMVQRLNWPFWPSAFASG